jgi:hypothetical protein
MTLRRPAIGTLLAVTVAACTSDDAAPASSDDARLAATLCGALREQTNVLVRLANSTVAGISAKSPEERFTTIADGFDAVETEVARYQSEVLTLELPDIAEAADLRAQLVEGAELAAQEVDSERALFLETGPTVPDDEVQGRVGQFFNSIEKVMSVAEPAMARYERSELLRAFRDQPTCEHVVQRVDPDDLED